MDEFWVPLTAKNVPIVGYEISSKGRLRSYRRGSAKKLREIPVLLRGHAAKDGYLRFIIPEWLRATIGSRWIGVHRLVLENFVGPCPPTFQACHNNGHRRDNRVSNLRWDSCKASMTDRSAHEKTATGEKHGRCKLSDADVAEIIRSRGLLSYRVLAAKYAVSEPYIHRLWRLERRKK